MDDEVLIRSVRRHSFLYDPCDKRHADVRLVKNTWEEVARSVHSPASDCKKRWTSLRDQFRRNVVKRLRSAAGAEGAGARVKWRYEDQMSFLLPHMKERPQKPCSKNPGRDAAASDDDDSSQSLEYSTTQSHASHRLESPSSTPSVSPVPSLPASDDEHHPHQSPRKRTKTSSQHQRDVLQNFFNGPKTRAPMDHIGAFFLAMEASVRRLPPLLQIEAKARVGALVSDLEMRAYVGEQPANFVANANLPSPRAVESAPVVHCSTTSTSNIPDEASANDDDEQKPFDD